MAGFGNFSALSTRAPTPFYFQQNCLYELAERIGALWRACALPVDNCAQEPDTALINDVAFSKFIMESNMACCVLPGIVLCNSGTHRVSSLFPFQRYFLLTA